MGSRSAGWRTRASLIPGRGRARPAPGPLEIQVRREPEHVIIAVAGEIDIATAARFGEELSGAAAAGLPVVADLGRVSFIDAAGLRALATAADQAAAHGGTLRVVCDDGHILRLFGITGLDRQVPLAPTVAAALESLGSGREGRRSA